MQCLKQFISASLSLINPPISQSKNQAFRARCRTHKIDDESLCVESVRENASKKVFSLPPNVEAITSNSNPFFKHCMKLRQSSSYRHLHGMILVVGATPVSESKFKNSRPKMLAGHPAIAIGGDLKPVMKLSREFVESVAGSNVCLVSGSEGGGLSQCSRMACELVAILMAGEFESLNVSVAGGIFMYMLQHHQQ